MPKPIRIMSVDLEPDLRSQRCKSMEQIPKLLDFFDTHKIKATFFTVSSMLEKFETQIKDISRKHEIASHSHTHRWFKESYAEEEIRNSKQAFKDYNITCKGFRAPAYITTKNHFALLKKYGYSYDSSLSWFFPGRYYHPGLPTLPFKTQGIIEFPLTSFIPPIINSGLSYLKAFDPLSKVFPRRYMFYLHPWEFLEQHQLPGSNGSLIKKMLRRNSGKKAWKILDNYISKTNDRWVSCQDWINASRIHKSHTHTEQ